MSEQSYPIPCPCSKLLYGPVNYCPYCGVLAPVKKERDAEPPPEEVKTVPESGAGNIPPPPEEGETKPGGGAGGVAPAPEGGKTEPGSGAGDPPVPGPGSNGGQNGEPGTGGELGGGIPAVNPPLAPARRPGPWKWVAGGIVIAAAIAGYLVFAPSQQGPGGPAGPGQEVTTPGVPRREVARILARETLSQGTALSVTISNLPKLERVLEAAQKLAEISREKYQDQLTSAENTISAARDNRDKNLMAYLSKLIELGRHAPEDISYALEIVRNGDLTARERIVAELVAEHVTSVRKNAKADPKKLLAGFTQRFKDFMD